jgi:hypothetical protein
MERWAPSFRGIARGNRLFGGVARKPHRQESYPQGTELS